ncbi:MAG: hypothetical protein ABL888_00740 [Pirellulaceae bacterium]
MPQDTDGNLTAHDPWVIRTFDDRPELWNSLKDRIAAPVGLFGFRANVKFVDDSKYYGLVGIDLVNALPAGYPGGFVFVADGDTTPDNEDTITLIYFYPNSTNPADYERPPSAVPAADLRSVRHLPHVVQELENNLSIANIDMTDVQNGLPADGIYRGIDQ